MVRAADRPIMSVWTLEANDHPLSASPGANRRQATPTSDTMSASRRHSALAHSIPFDVSIGHRRLLRTQGCRQRPSLASDV